MKKFIKWYKEDPNDPPTFVGTLAFSNKELFWFAVLIFTALAIKIALSINL
jgi:hypothetical protein